MKSNLGSRRIVLLGCGHTNAYILKMWRMQPIPDTELICISNFPVATYSGMFPGVLAGQYRKEAMDIDLVRLCQSVGARLIIDNVTGIDHSRRRIIFSERSELDFDLLSIGIGSEPAFQNVFVRSDNRLVPIKPMQTFLTRIDAHLQQLTASNSRLESASQSDRNPSGKIAIVGGGVGSIEIAFCLDQRLKASGIENIAIELVTAGDKVGHQLLASTQSRIQRSLESRNISLRTNSRINEIDDGGLTFSDGSQQKYDLLIWVTTASPPALIAQLGLATDQNGFIQIHPTLQTITSENIFSVGDTASLIESPTPKAGVYAVRQGPVLWRNLQHKLRSEPLESYHPQSQFLKLINLGDGTAIGEYRQFSFQGNWVWKLKSRIDSKFIAMYQDYQSSPMIQSTSADAPMPMRCLGCGGKIGAEVLSEVLRDLDIPDHPDVILGLDHPDDAAIIRTHDNQVTITTDFFASPLNDPYLTGRIAALNAASDLYVMGAQPTVALAMVQLPTGHPRGQVRLMRELMAGSLHEIRRMGGTIAGGHSIEGPQLTIGFTFFGKQMVSPKTKGGLQVGDQLVLTKPLGTGVLLAAAMRSQLKGEFYQPLILSMLQPNSLVLELMQHSLISTATDVTGFGLAGHLLEMLEASKLSAHVDLGQIPLLPGVESLVREGIESTLTPQNRSSAEPKIDAGSETRRHPAFDLLFDPQTCGGLLMGVPQQHLSQVQSKLHSHGLEKIAVIGQIHALTDGKPDLVLI